MSEDAEPRLLVHRAAAKVAEGDKEAARALLVEALTADPKYGRAWMWYASLCEDRAEEKYCLHRSVKYAPTRATRRALAALDDVKAKAPEGLSTLEDAAPPAAYQRVEKAMEAGSRRRWLIAGAAGLAVILLLGLGYAAFWRPGAGSPVKIALVGGLSGAEEQSGRDMINSAQMFLDELNDSGGVGGHPLRLETFDDRDDPAEAKRVAERLARRKDILAVIGHRVSVTSAAAGPVYKAAGIPVITPTATADTVTEDNPWYFRTIFNNKEQGRFLAEYLHHVLGQKTASVVYTDKDYGLTLLNGFRAEFNENGAIKHAIQLDTLDDVPAAIATLRADPQRGTIVLAAREDLAKPLVIGLRDAGVTATILGGDTLGTDSLIDALREAEKGRPGKYTGNLFAASPLLIDSLSGAELRWLKAFRDRFGTDPVWDAATTYAAVAVVAETMRKGLDFGSDKIAHDRTHIRDALAAAKDPQSAISTKIGPVQFDDTRSDVRPIGMGMIDPDFGLVSAPTQLTPYTPQAGVDIEKEIAAGRALRHGDRIMVRQQIAAVGINMNEVSNLDTKDQTFQADFFLWFHYVGGAEVTDVEFPNATTNIKLDPPVRETKAGASTYRLYRVTGKFKSTMDFRRFPFDRQLLPIELQNRKLPSERLVYVSDRQALKEAREKGLVSGRNLTATIDHLPNWNVVDLDLHRETVGSATGLGDPTVPPDQADVFYSQYAASMTIRRDVSGFLIKNMLPLLLLVCVTFISLFFAYEPSSTRVSFGVTGILSSAVLLGSVTSALPNVSYVVAIEWAYYAFILLSALCVLVALLGERLMKRKRSVRWLTRAARIGYPVYVLSLVGIYLWIFT